MCAVFNYNAVIMSSTRRRFLQSTAAVATGAVAAPADNPLAAKPATLADSRIEVPKSKLGGVEVSRLILGVNPFYGFSHYNNNFSSMMRDWYTQSKVIEVMKHCEECGINAFNYVQIGRGQSDWDRYSAEGGKMRMVAQATTKDPEELVKAVKPWAAWVQGEITDRQYRAGQLGAVRDYAKKLRDLGVAVVGVASHIPEVLMTIESQSWEIDFYAGSAYNIRRTPEELRTLLGGEIPEMSGDVYLQDDPARMYSFFRQTSKPCVAYKILAAGRVQNVEHAFQTAYAGIKPIDFVCVGMFPRTKDEVKENAQFATRYGAVHS